MRLVLLGIFLSFGLALAQTPPAQQLTVQVGS